MKGSDKDQHGEYFFEPEPSEDISNCIDPLLVVFPSENLPGLHSTSFDSLTPHLSLGPDLEGASELPTSVKELQVGLLLPHRDLIWGKLPLWFRLFTYLMVGFTLFDLVVVFIREPVFFAVFPIAVLPAIFGLYAALYLTRVTSIPTRFYLWSLLSGGCVGTFLSVILNTAAVVLTGETIVISFIAPFVEELIKLLVVLVIISVSSRVSSVVVNRYTATATGIAVGAGFTLVEDIMYLSNGSTLNEALTIAVGRTLLSPFVHMVCTAFVGYGVGLIIEHRRGGGISLLSLFVLACGVHSVWNITSQLSFEISLLLSFLITTSFLFAIRIISAENLRKVRERAGEVRDQSDYTPYHQLSEFELDIITSSEISFRNFKRDQRALYVEIADLQLAVAELLLAYEPSVSTCFAECGALYSLSNRCKCSPTLQSHLVASSIDKSYYNSINERWLALMKARVNLFRNQEGVVFMQSLKPTGEVQSKTTPPIG